MGQLLVGRRRVTAAWASLPRHRHFRYVTGANRVGLVRMDPEAGGQKVRVCSPWWTYAFRRGYEVMSVREGPRDIEKKAAEP
jgi:hypothetical protein